MESIDSDENVFDFKSNQVNEHGETLITLPCRDSAPEIEQQEDEAFYDETFTREYNKRRMFNLKINLRIFTCNLDNLVIPP